jgi:hypothetical protein
LWQKCQWPWPDAVSPIRKSPLFSPGHEAFADDSPMIYCRNAGV